MDFMRLTPSQEVNNPTGFTKDSLALTRVETFFLYLVKKYKFLRWLATRLGLKKLMARASIMALDNYGSYMLISTRDWSDSGRFDVGRTIMKTWLELTQEDIACQPVDFPISSEEGRKTIKRLFGVDDGVRPVLLMRLGRASRTHVAMSIRKPLEDFIELELSSVRKK
ncbi:MAG: hypothetical protein M1270_04575 [Gammaproteobacteria bacterium]|nr:hypothetical protein [Gammaproteobacteria bacterium]